jgi:serine protease AprX
MKVSVCTIRVFVAIALWLLAAAPAAAGDRAHRSKLDKALRDAQRHAPQVQRVIVQARPGSRAELKQALQAHGDIIEAEHPSLDALTVTLHGGDLAALDADPRVVAVSVDAEVTSFGNKGRGKNRPATARGDLLRTTLGLDELQYYGGGVNVAIVDSGVDPTSDLAPKIAGFWDYTGRRNRAYDDYGHGTHIASVIASSGLEPLGRFGGVAPDVRLYAFKVLDEDGRGRASDVIRALEFIVANKRSSDPGAFAIDVINLSLGHPIYEPAESDPLVKAVEQAVRAGIVVVTAAGNMGSRGTGEAGYAGITSPGNAPSAITVGASDTRDTQDVADDRVAYFSSRGPTWFDGYAKPDLVAAGVSLTANAPRHASLYDKYPELKSGHGWGTFGTLSGTSVATAVTTGIASLVLEASRDANAGRGLTPNALKGVLQFTALSLNDTLGQPYDALTQGAGEVNARGAVSMARRINTRMNVGDNWLRVQGAVTATFLGGRLVPWSQQVIWEDTIVAGPGLLDRYLAQWAGNIVWGTALGCAPSDFQCENIVWGTAVSLENIVWGTAVAWADDIVWPNRIVGMFGADENIVWGTFDALSDENIVWGTFDGENIVWGTLARRTETGDPVWGVSDDENIVWGTFTRLDNIVWGTFGYGLENIVWGTMHASGTAR